jgi:hypothetical protein
MCVVSACLQMDAVAKIESLKPGAHGQNLRVIVHELKLVLTRERMDGSQTRIAEALVGDRTGCILLSAKNGLISNFIITSFSLEQVEHLQKNSTITLINAKVEVFDQHMHLVVDKWGCVNVHISIKTKLAAG